MQYQNMQHQYQKLNQRLFVKNNFISKVKPGLHVAKTIRGFFVKEKVERVKSRRTAF